MYLIKMKFFPSIMELILIQLTKKEQIKHI